MFAATLLSRRAHRSAPLFVMALLLLSIPTTVVLAAEPGEDAGTLPASSFSAYRTNYLVIGPEHSPVAGNTTSKFQLSLKYDTGANWYFAYTQRSYWDIARDSSPILDHNIEPGVFYFWKPSAEFTERWSIASARTGFVHESNGKEGESSRAWNRAYVEPLFRWHEYFFEPKLWMIASTDEQNKNIKDYYGYADIVFGVETGSRQRFTVTGRQGLKHGSLQIDLSLPANSLFTGNTMRPYLYAQLWTGYGETLSYYNLRTSALRIGIEFHP